MTLTAQDLWDWKSVQYESRCYELCMDIHVSNCFAFTESKELLHTDHCNFILHALLYFFSISAVSVLQYHVYVCSGLIIV